MAAEDRKQAGRDLFPGQPKRRILGDLDKTFAAGLNLQGMECLPHKNKINAGAGPRHPANHRAVTSAFFILRIARDRFRRQRREAVEVIFDDRVAWKDLRGHGGLSLASRAPPRGRRHPQLSEIGRFRGRCPSFCQTD